MARNADNAVPMRSQATVSSRAKVVGSPPPRHSRRPATMTAPVAPPLREKERPGSQGNSNGVNMVPATAATRRTSPPDNPWSRALDQKLR